MQSQNKISMCCIFTRAVLQFKSNLCSNHRYSLASEKFHYDMRFEKKMFSETNNSVYILQVPAQVSSGARSEFGGVASRVPSLQATLPPSPQIFSVISDTSCHTPYLFFKNTNCVTPPQIIFANLRRFPSKLQFPKNFDLYI